MSGRATRRSSLSLSCRSRCELTLAKQLRCMALYVLLALALDLLRLLALVLELLGGVVPALEDESARSAARSAKRAGQRKTRTSASCGRRGLARAWPAPQLRSEAREASAALEGPSGRARAGRTRRVGPPLALGLDDMVLVEVGEGEEVCRAARQASAGPKSARTRARGTHRRRREPSSSASWTAACGRAYSPSA